MDDRQPPDDDTSSPLARKGSFGQTLRAVGWSFLGIRRSAGLEEDAKRLNPIHVIVAGVLAVALFVLLLVILVHWVTSSGVMH
jgi:hypothetical protein